MTLTYGNYLELISALDEYCKGSLEKKDLQNAIFDHYMESNNFIVAENAHKSKKVFINSRLKKGNQKAERNKFRNFMNVPPRVINKSRTPL